MRDLQVLVAAMHQTDFSLVEHMNILCDAIIANQSDTASIRTEVTDSGTRTMITTPTRGVGLNRNIALLAADAELLLFADDDITYYDGTLTGVRDAFRALPEADAIVFSVDLSQNSEIYEKRHLPIQRRHTFNALKFGTYALAVRRDAILRENITFSQLFGGGCIYGSGEDSLFILDCLRHGLKVYTHSYVLGVCKKDSSSWFAGFGEKYFYDKGAFFATAFPRTKRLICLAFALRMQRRKKNEIPFSAMLKMMRAGRRGVNRFIPYKDYKKNGK